MSRINGVRLQSAGNTTDDAEWMRNDAALFPDGLTKGQLLNRLCDHHELLDYTSRFMTKPHSQHRRLATETQDKMSHVFENSTRPKGNKPKLTQVIIARSQADKEK